MSAPPDLATATARDIGAYDASLAGWYNHETHELSPGFPIAPEDVVIDVGCGEGGFAAFCGMQGAHVIVTDLDPERVAQAVKLVSDTAARTVEGKVGDGARLPFPDGVATRVICTEVLEHVDDPAATMAELVRVAAPGALFLVTVPGAAQERVQKHVAYFGYFLKPNHIRIVEPAELDALVEGAGLVIERRGADGFFWSFWFANFWQFAARLGEAHPTLDLWARTWLRVIEGPNGRAIKKALDAVLPKRQVIVARKPG